MAVVQPYHVNGLNQYTSAGGSTLAYDADGNLSSDGSSTYGYDAENRLISATGAKTATLVYDPLGRLWSTTGAQANSTTLFLHDGDEIALEMNGRVPSCAATCGVRASTSRSSGTRAGRSAAARRARGRPPGCCTPTTRAR